MSDETRAGGEPDGARLLELARHELLETLVPLLEGDARYRARLIANALKIAGHELGAGTRARAATARALQAYAEIELPAAVGLEDTQLPRMIAAAIRAGRLDGQAELHNLLLRLTEGRQEALD